MKISINGKALSAFKKLGAVALITATILTQAVFFTACKQTGNTSGGSGKPTPTPTPKPKHVITFSVEGANGTLKAKADGIDETSTSPITVEEGKTVTFTATANDGYRVKGWTLDDKAVNGINTEYKLTVTKAATVKVSFESDSTPPKPKHAITFSVDGTPPHGTLKAKAEGVDETSTSPINVEGGKEVTFTATPEANHRVKNWTLDGNTIAEAGRKTEYKFTVSQPATVSVSFELKPEEKAVLTLGSTKKDIKVKAVTSDGSAIAVEGCNEKTLESGVEATLKATGETVTLKGKLTELECNWNQLTALDVQGLAALQKLSCHYNQLSTLNVQGLTALQMLDCISNQLTELNVQGLTALQELGCSNNKLTSLNVQGLTALEKLTLNNNQLASLDVQGLTALQELSCHYNKLSSLGTQGCTSLQKIKCYNNQLKTLDIQGLTSLQELECYSNELSSLGIQGLATLKKLDCEKNQLTSLNVQGLTALEKLTCNNNQLASLDVKSLTSLQELSCGSNKLTLLDVKDLTTLKQLSCYDNQLTSLVVSGCTSLKTLNCFINKLNEKAMIELLKALPSREAGDDAKATLYTEDASVTEGNHKDFTQGEDLKKAVGEVKAKHWKLMKKDEYGSSEEIG